MHGIQQIKAANEQAAIYEINRQLTAARTAGKSYAVKVDEFKNIDPNLVPYIFDTQTELNAFIRGKLGIRESRNYQTYYGVNA